MKVLHIIRRGEDPIVSEAIDHDRSIGEVSILLIQDGVLFKVEGDGQVFASINDVVARGVSVPYRLIDYQEMCRLIVEHDRVVVW